MNSLKINTIEQVREYSVVISWFLSKSDLEQILMTY